MADLEDLRLAAFTWRDAAGNLPGAGLQSGFSGARKARGNARVGPILSMPAGNWVEWLQEFSIVWDER